MHIYHKHIPWWIFPKLERLVKSAPRSKANMTRASPVMQWTWVSRLVQEDSTRCGSTKSAHHIYWAWVLQLLKPMYLELEQQEQPSQWEAHTLQWRAGPAWLEKLVQSTEDSAAINKWNITSPLNSLPCSHLVIRSPSWIPTARLPLSSFCNLYQWNHTVGTFFHIWHFAEYFF